MTQQAAFKTCKVCGTLKPNSLEAFGNNGYSKNGTLTFRAICKACAKKERVVSPIKCCKQCGVNKPKTAEFFRINGKPTTNGTPTFRPVCRECGLKVHRPKLKSNEKWCKKCDRIMPATTDYFYRVKRDQEVLSHTCRACNRSAGKIWLKANPERKAEQGRLFRLSRPGYAAALARRRRARKIAQTPDGHHHTAEDVHKRLKAQKERCHWCGKSLRKGKELVYHADHLIALAKGGSNAPENIVCACPDCNLRKNAKMPWDFAGRLL